jgi:antitoxin (DNA-binding transcriptional repressor) of toxin-antitoxin stability system
VDQAANGEPFVIAKAGKPLVKVTPLDTPTGKQVRRLGFLAGQFSVPKDFNAMGSTEIERLFGGASEAAAGYASAALGGE